MANCRYKKIIQFYLDGWADRGKIIELDEHLKNCPECQLELAEIEELNLAASDIIDEAPDRNYWASFYARIRNRIVARNIEPLQAVRKPFWSRNLRTASVLVTLALFVGSAALVIGPRMKSAPDPNSTKSLPAHESLSIPRSDLAATMTSGKSLPDIDQGSQVSTGPSSVAVDAKSRPEQGLRPPQLSSPSSRLSVLETQDPSTHFRQLTSLKTTSSGPRIEFEAPQVYQTVQYDESYRLRGSFVGQRLLSDVGISPQKASSPVYQGIVFGNLSNLTGSRAGEMDFPVSWGYMRVPTDTSKANEMKRYFIELELMQTK